MASLYLHIPFCKKACHYCSFYFTLSPVKKEAYVYAIIREIGERAAELMHQNITSIYLGGGTPTILTSTDLEKIMRSIQDNYSISSQAEISIESNPENLTLDYIQSLRDLSFNRLSIGVQSFADADLEVMNRNHTTQQALKAIENAHKLFDNLSIDLIFGLPYSGMQQWTNNLKQAIELDVKHISTYNLAVEEKTALARKVGRNELPIESDDTLNEMYLYTIEELGNAGFIHYEISNFGKESYWSQHNLGYWMQTPYLGFGPSAHSYIGEKRRWNVSNLKLYIEGLAKQNDYWKQEHLSLENRYNEYIMTRLRTIFGIHIDEIRTTFGENFEIQFLDQVRNFENQNLIIREDKTFKLTNSGKILADAIASDLMC
jgi:oxygen-independent coproporphyrinogen-3 oxidase